MTDGIKVSELCAYGDEIIHSYVSGFMLFFFRDAYKGLVQSSGANRLFVGMCGFTRRPRSTTRTMLKRALLSQP